VEPGEIYRHDAFYRNPTTRALERKYLLTLARLRGNDIVARLLTSRAHGRPEAPPCYHGLPYAGFYLGVPGGPLTTKTWVDLRYLDDVDEREARLLQERGVLSLAGRLEGGLLIGALECAAAADDTTRMQEQAIRDFLATLR
jgi:hypothetical protein